MMKKLATYTLVYGLSADPVHQQHLDLLEEGTKVIIELGYPVVRLLIIPVYRRNPVGSKEEIGPFAAFEYRLAMCRLVSDDISQVLSRYSVSVEVSCIEQQLAQGPGKCNYTVETLQTLKDEENRGMNYILLLGSDLFSGDDPELKLWYQMEKLIQLATLAIYPRPGYPINEDFLEDIKHLGACVLSLANVKVADISSSEIRQLLSTGAEPLSLSNQGLVPESIALYIKEKALYH